MKHWAPPVPMKRCRVCKAWFRPNSHKHAAVAKYCSRECAAVMRTKVARDAA